MTVRPGMYNLITRLRGMTNAGTADWELGTEVYWSDQHLQDVLDHYVTALNRTPLDYELEYTNGTATYFDYYAPIGNFEEAASGSAYWRIENGAGIAIDSDGYAVDYATGAIRFLTDQRGTAYYLRARSYNLNKAAAEVWHRKAAFYAEKITVTTDNHKLMREQLIANALKMAAEYDAKAGTIQSLKVVRSDLNNAYE